MGGSKIVQIVLEDRLCIDEDATAFTFNTESSSSYSEADIWFFDQRSPLVQQASSQSISGETFNYTVPAQTAMHFVLK